MGVLNITPDSFSDGGEYYAPNKAIKRFGELLDQGADIIDIGAQSTRPGALEISPDDELRRLVPCLKAVRKQYPNSVISIDTFHSNVAEESLSLGANFINDVTGGRRDPEILKIVADASSPS